MILVTGGTGLVGMHLLYQLATSGKKVSAIKRPGSDTNLVLQVFKHYSPEGDYLFKQIEWVTADILDIYSLLDVLEEVEYVYHCAALVSHKPADRDKMMQINVSGTANVVNACLEKKVKKLCAVSSTAAIGPEPPGKEVSENAEWVVSSKNSDYSVSKHLAEMEVWRGIAEGLDAVIVNPAIVLGPGNWNNSSLILFKTLSKGMRYHTDGINGFVDARDVALVMEQLMESDTVGERYLLVSESLPFKTVIRWILRALGHSPKTKLAGKFTTGLLWRLEKIRSLFGGTPTLTKQSVASAHQQTTYSSEKVREALAFKFIGVENSVENAALYFRNYGTI